MNPLTQSHITLERSGNSYFVYALLSGVFIPLFTIFLMPIRSHFCQIRWVYALKKGGG